MDRYCPECNSTMTPSLVGYLCSECGNLQRFYTMSGTQLQTTKIPTPKSLSGADGPLDKKLPPVKKNSIDSMEDASINSGNKVRSTLKRLMVPEISPPHDHGEPAKILKANEVIDSSNIFENYDDLLDTSVKESDSEIEADSAQPNPATAAIVEEKVQNLEESKKLQETPPKKIPVWVWVVSALVLFISVAISLLLIIVL